MNQAARKPLPNVTRQTALKIAAVLSLIVGLLGIVFYDIPNLMLGAAASDGPYWLVLGSFVTDILVFVAAYGAWRAQKWGAVLLILINAFWIVQSIFDLLFGSTTDFIFAGVMLIHHIIVILLCLWRERAVGITAVA